MIKQFSLSLLFFIYAITSSLLHTEAQRSNSPSPFAHNGQEPIPTQELQKKLQNLTLDQKIGQLFMVPAVVNEELNKNFMLASSAYRMMCKDSIAKLIKEYHIGGIIYLGASSLQEQIEQTNYFHTLNNEDPTSPRLIFGQDLEWGLAQRFLNPQDVVRFPKNMCLGALNEENISLIYCMGREVARQAHELGISIIFAPVVDVNIEPKNPIIGERSFGSDPDQVAKRGQLFARGLQDGGIIAVAKHFPGHGNTQQDSHICLPKVNASQQQLQAVELIPFKALINTGVHGVMTSHLEVPALGTEPNQPVSLSSHVVTDLLRNKLAFNGLIFTDGMGMQGVLSQCPPGNAELEALKAGHDIILCPTNTPKAIGLIKQALVDGTLSYQDLDAKVARILQAKEWLRAVVNQGDEPLVYNHEHFHTAYAYALKEKLYSSATTVLHNHDAIPIKSSVSRSHAIAYLQIGGHSSCEFYKKLTAHMVCNAHFLPSKPVDNDFKNIFDELNNHETIIVGIFDINKIVHIEHQEQVYNYGIANALINAINDLCTSGKKVILTLFGIPYSASLFNNTDATVLAYEDDPQAQISAANVILGAAQAQGILPVIL